MKLNITIDGKTYEVDVEVAEADHAGLPPAYPIGSARLAGTIFSATNARPACVNETRLALRLPSRKEVSTRPRLSSMRSAELIVCLG